MNTLAQYTLAVTAAAVLTALITALAGQGTMAALAKLLGGLFMALTILSPLVRLQLPDWQEWSAAFAMDGEAAAAAGQAMANEAAAAIITEEVEAYIRDKADACGVSVDVAVRLDTEGIPVGVTLTGKLSSDAKEDLTRIISDDLGIGEEDQEWIS